MSTSGVALDISAHSHDSLCCLASAKPPATLLRPLLTYIWLLLASETRRTHLRSRNIPHRLSHGHDAQRISRAKVRYLEPIMLAQWTKQ